MPDIRYTREEMLEFARMIDNTRVLPRAMPAATQLERPLDGCWFKAVIHSFYPDDPTEDPLVRESQRRRRERHLWVSQLPIEEVPLLFGFRSISKTVTEWRLKIGR